MRMLNFSEKNPLTEEEMNQVKEMVESGKLEGLDEYIIKRFSFLLDNTYNAATTRTDDYLIEVVGKHMWKDKKYDAVKTAVTNVLFKQFKAQLDHRLFEMKINFEDFKDIQQDVYMIICEHITNYDSSKNQFSAFITRQVDKLIFEHKNRAGSGSGLSTTRYGASITKHAMNAKNALIEMGRSDPGYDQIARYINAKKNLSIKITAKMVENALKSVAVQVDMDDRQGSSDYDPENMLMEKTKIEVLLKLKDSLTLSKDCRALMSILINHYIVENGSKNLNVEKLKEALKEQTGKDFSSEQIAGLKQTLADHLEKTGWFSGSKKKKNNSSFKTIDNFIADEDEADQIEIDILSCFE